MGEVWAAHRTGRLGVEKLVALKLLPGVELGSNVALMFLDEARATLALQHPAIVPTSDAGQDGDTLYLAMDLVRGPSLTALLQRLALARRPPPPSVVAHLGERIASALDYSYARASADGKLLKLIHRDVSPHNVLLEPTGTVRLSDFGVARSAIQEHRSQVGTIRGKPSYMAPEQIRGEAVDARSDLFALGVVLYETACITRLFGRTTPQKAMQAVLEYTPEPLPAVLPGFPPALWTVIARLLEKDPAARQASAGEVARVLGELGRTVPGSGSAERDLGGLIEGTFPAGAFDIDARVREALAEIDAATDSEPTHVTWPSTSASDPLAPEAMAELEAELSIRGLQVPRARWTWSPRLGSPSRTAAVLGVGALAAVSAVAAVLSLRSAPPPRKLAPPRAEVAPSRAPSGSSEAPAAAGTPVPPPPPIESRPNAGAPPEAPVAPIPPRHQNPRPPPGSSPAASGTPSASRATPAPAPPASPAPPADVRTLRRRIAELEARDPEAANTFRLQLAELVSQNAEPKRLAALAAQVEAALAR
jgi:serine/threonine-protein kinase